MRKMVMHLEEGGTNRNRHESMPSRHDLHHHRHHHSHVFSRLGVRILLLSMVVGLFYLVLSQSPFPIQLLRRSYSLNYLTPTCKSERETASSSSNEKTHEFTSNNEDLPSYVSCFQFPSGYFFFLEKFILILQDFPINMLIFELLDSNL